MTNTSGFLILDVTDDELAILRAVRDTEFAGDATKEQIDRAVDRGLVDRVGGDYGGFALATPGLHTLWHHERPRGFGDEAWERCRACGSIDLMRHESWPSSTIPTRVDCRTCGYKWTPEGD